MTITDSDTLMLVSPASIPISSLSAMPVSNFGQISYKENHTYFWKTIIDTIWNQFTDKRSFEDEC